MNTTRTGLTFGKVFKIALALFFWPLVLLQILGCATGWVLNRFAPRFTGAEDDSKGSSDYEFPSYGEVASNPRAYPFERSSYGIKIRDFYGDEIDD